MFKWLRELYEIRREYRICESCENLKMELARAHDENKLLLSYVMNPPKVEEPLPEPGNLKPILPTVMPWSIRKRMLEEEGRKQAELIKKSNEERAARIESIEKELGVEENANQ